MPDRNLQIVKFVGATPSYAYCDVCKLAFKTLPENILDADKAKAQLLAEFEKHECRPQPEEVDEVLTQIKL